MRKISATYIFPGNRAPMRNGILTCGDDGTIISLTDTQGRLQEEQGLEYYNGIVVPGFINCHCHLELSYMKGKIPEKTGIGNFIGEVNRLRNIQIDDDEMALNNAVSGLWATGTVAVGDVSNSLLTLEVKKKGKLFYHTFAEAFGFLSSRTERAFEHACYIERVFRENGLRASVVPHSPYSVSETLFRKITYKAIMEKSILSIHNQESKGEEQFFRDGTGPIANHMKKNLNLDISEWNPTGDSSLHSTLRNLPYENPLLLVHNTFTSKEDIELIKKKRPYDNTFFVLCPNSNLYIEGHLPPLSLFVEENLNICLGTDSLASNHQLSVFAEMITLHLHFPEVSFYELVRWASLNGARALQVENFSGSLDPGKKPGINLITGADLQNIKLTAKSKIRRLI
ncbi:MAG: amidohydrolase family protein [Prolixibacteraceae bacterium]|nr:amidohydrolase family protein [Prolixibacteraceae bacterium]